MEAIPGFLFILLTVGLKYFFLKEMKLQKNYFYKAINAKASTTLKVVFLNPSILTSCRSYLWLTSNAINKAVFLGGLPGWSCLETWSRPLSPLMPHSFTSHVLQSYYLTAWCNLVINYTLFSSSDFMSFSYWHDCGFFFLNQAREF